MVDTIAAADAGFANIKAVSGAYDEQTIIIPAIFADFTASDYILSGDTNSLNDLQNIVIEYNNQRFFVGDAAHRYGVAQQTLDFNYYTSLHGIAAVLFALLCVSNIEKYVKKKVVLGLPISEFGKQKDNYRCAITGRHYLNLLNLDGAVMSKHCVDITDVTVLPQPVGTFFKVILRADGAIDIDNEQLTIGRVGVVDIGGHTVDVACIDNMQYVNRLSDSYSDVGGWHVQKTLAAEIDKTYGIKIMPERLPYLISSEGRLRIRGCDYDVSPLRRSAAFSVADVIVSRLRNLWPDVWEMNRVFLTGGGAHLVGDTIAHALDPQHSGQVQTVGNPVMANVVGFYRLGRRLWGGQVMRKNA